MKYDVFISYSRLDMTVADRICAAFDKAGITYFIDRQGIGGGLEFPKVLAHAIVDSEKFLFLASANSYDSKFTNSEITFAFNKKAKESILPYRIDDCEMPLELEFVFCNINWRNIKDHPIETVLVDDMLRMLGRTLQPHDSIPTIPTIARPKTYKIGDYYNENGKEGIVFEVDAAGCHGKIMAMRDLQKKLAWCTSVEWNNRLEIGVEDEVDGMKNMEVVRRIFGWKEKYPAFAGCAALGEGWYLPAKEELERLYGNAEYLSRQAEVFGGLPFAFVYWSSSEGGSTHAWVVDFGSGVFYINSKYYQYRVRPVAAF